MYDITGDMGAAYSKDLRERVLNHIGKGHTRQRAAELFQVGLNSIYRWQRLKKGGESLAAKVRAATPRKLDYEKLKAYVKANTDATLVEYAKEFRVSATAIFNAFRKLGITRKKSRSFTRNGMRRKEGSLLKK